MSEVAIRIASEADAAILSELERRSPLQLGDAALVIDRGDDYFAAARLMANATVLLAEVDGEPAGVLAGAVHPACLDGRPRNMLYIHHARIPPEFQRHGLGRALAAKAHEIAREQGYDSAYWYIAKNNARSQGFARNAANRWSFGPILADLPARPTGVPAPAFRPATPADAGHIVEILNAAHSGEEMFLPYTEDSLRERLERAPAQYGWPNLWLGEGAVVGAWPTGDYIRTILIGPDGTRHESREASVLDYGCLPGYEDEIAGLLRALCSWAYERGYQSVSIFTSRGSRLRDVVLPLAEEATEFDFWTPAIPEPAGAAERGLYVDPIYF